MSSLVTRSGRPPVSTPCQWPVSTRSPSSSSAMSEASIAVLAGYTALPTTGLLSIARLQLQPLTRLEHLARVRELFLDVVVPRALDVLAVVLLLHLVQRMVWRENPQALIPRVQVRRHLAHVHKRDATLLLARMLHDL